MDSMNTDDDKYVTFRRDQFKDWDFSSDDPHWSQIEITDAIVIRRQDYFASPALAGYASAIAIALKVLDHPDPEQTKKDLLKVADYFEDQAKLAAEEGWKTPDV